MPSNQELLAKNGVVGVACGIVCVSERTSSDEKGTGSRNRMWSLESRMSTGTTMTGHKSPSEPLDGAGGSNGRVSASNDDEVGAAEFKFLRTEPEFDASGGGSAHGMVVERIEGAAAGLPSWNE